MKNIRFFPFFIVFFFALLSTSSSFATTRGIRIISKQGEKFYLYKDYHAIVIGISDYEKWPKLPNAVNDAREVAFKLKQIGFDVQLVVNPTSNELKFTFNDIARRLGTEKNRALLIYFAGHGETTMLTDGSQLGFIVPKDCPLQSLDPLGFDKKAVSMKEIEMLALRVKSIHMLMLFDSCFSGSLFSMKRAAPMDVSEKSANPVRQFITAGTAEEPVPDKSVFKICFLQGIAGYADYNKDSYITGSELGMYLQTQVINYTRGAQHPQYGKINNPLLDKGDFIFSINVDQKDDSKSPKEEQIKLASIPKSVTVSRVTLREKPMMVRSESEINKMLLKYGFFETSRNPLGAFENLFVDNNNGTVTDRSTGLMWQKSGSSSSLNNRDAKGYINQLNKERFAGHSDWRMPTIEELASLINKDKRNGVHIDPLFGYKQIRCWTVDKCDSKYDTFFPGSWIVNFTNGTIGQAIYEDLAGWDVHVHRKNRSNYIKTVRSAK
jgi:uncharacterized caspase-like protein